VRPERWHVRRYFEPAPVRGEMRIVGFDEHGLSRVYLFVGDVHVSTVFPERDSERRCAEHGRPDTP